MADLQYATVAAVCDLSEMVVLGERLSVDGNTRLFKVEASVSNLVILDDIGADLLTYEEALALVQTPEWQPEVPE